MIHGTGRFTYRVWLFLMAHVVKKYDNMYPVVPWGWNELLLFDL